MHTVNVEKVRYNVDQHGLIRADLLYGREHVFNAGPHVALLIGLAGGLLTVFEQRDTEHEPPHGGQAKDEPEAGQHRHADGVHDEEDQQGDRRAADVAEAVAQRRDRVHAVLRRDVGQESVVVDAGRIKADGACDVEHQHHRRDPARRIRRGGEVHERREGKPCYRDNTDEHKCREQLFAHTADVAEYAQERRAEGDDGHSQAGGEAPGGHAGHAVGGVARNGVEEDGQDGHDDDRVGAVGPVVHHPADLLFGEFFQEAHGRKPPPLLLHAFCVLV